MQATTISAAERLAALRAWIAAHGLDGMILTTADAFQNEDAPEHDRVLAWLTGFTGSLAHALVTSDDALLLVDGRYGIQARRQVDGSLWRFGHIHDQPISGWLDAGRTIGFDAMRWTVNQAIRLRRSALSATLMPCGDSFAEIWLDRPPMPAAPLRAVPDARTGRGVADKLAWLREKTAASGADLWIETRPDNIAWMLNVRGGDVARNPIPLSFAVFEAEGPTHWFIDAAKVVVPLPGCVRIHPVGTFVDWLEHHARGRRAAFDPAFTPDAVAAALARGGAIALPSDGAITIAKARKTSAEIVGFRTAHLDDAVAMARFGHWLASVRERAEPVDEWDASETLAGFRTWSPRYLEPSFVTIAATGENAALCHYAPAREGSARLDAADIFLCDSGGQYDCGTTDVTRTWAFGPVPDDIRTIATAVLRGFIALSSARFPVGTMPHQIDALARIPLWSLGLDYDHGTGHGVGHNLLVHEHPHRLGKLPNPHGLEAGHVLTIEPGFYDEGRWGIRIENQVEVVERGDDFLGFDPMTLVPIDLTPFDLDALTLAERGWIDAYHARVRKEVVLALDGEVADWLVRATEPIAMDQRAPQVSDRR